MIHCLQIAYPTGYVSFRTYPSELARVIEMILLSSQPVVLTVINYDDDEDLLARRVRTGSQHLLQSSAASDGGDQ